MIGLTITRSSIVKEHCRTACDLKRLFIAVRKVKKKDISTYFFNLRDALQNVFKDYSIQVSFQTSSVNIMLKNYASQLFRQCWFNEKFKKKSMHRR